MPCIPALSSNVAAHHAALLHSMHPWTELPSTGIATCCRAALTLRRPATAPTPAPCSSTLKPSSRACPSLVGTQRMLRGPLMRLPCCQRHCQAHAACHVAHFLASIVIHCTACLPCSHVWHGAGVYVVWMLLAVHDDIVEQLKEMGLPTAPKGNAGQGGCCAASCWPAEALLCSLPEAARAAHLKCTPSIEVVHCECVWQVARTGGV